MKSPKAQTTFNKKESPTNEMLRFVCRFFCHEKDDCDLDRGNKSETQCIIIEKKELFSIENGVDTGKIVQF